MIDADVNYGSDCSALQEQPQSAATGTEQAHLMRVGKLRKEAFHSFPPAASWRFPCAEMTDPLRKTQRYAEEWDTFRSDGTGLLLFGNVGTGKTYAAGCIANALLDRETPVLMVSMTEAVNHMYGNWGADQNHYLASLIHPALLILDDLGAERNTSYAKECVFEIINRRLLSGRPMIITTNISVNDMQAAVDLPDRRIYDRILQCCIPIWFECQNFRKGIAAANLERARGILAV